MKPVAFAGSTIGSFWYEAAVLLKKALVRHGVDLEIDTTTTDFRNVLAVGHGTHAMGVTLPLFLDLAQRRESVYATERLADLRVIAALNKPTWLAAAVDRRTGFRSLSELIAARHPWRVALPPRDNLAGVYIDHLLEAHGTSRDGIVAWGGAERHPVAIGPRTGNGPWVMRTITPELGRSGEIDGFFMYITWVSAWARDLTTLLDVRFLRFDDAALERVRTEHGGDELTLPARLFPGADEDMPGAGWRHEYLYGTADTSADLVRTVLLALEDETILDNAHGFSYSAFRAPTLPAGLRLHPVTEEYFERRRIRTGA